MKQVQEQVQVPVHGKNYVSLNRKKASCYVAYFLESSGYSWESLRRGVRLAAELLKIPHDGLRRSAIAVRCMDKLIQMNIHPPMGYQAPWSKIQILNGIRIPKTKRIGGGVSMTKGTCLPDDWKPTDSDFEYGYGLGLSEEEINDAAEDMRLWAGANQNRAVARKSNWSLAFKGWMRRNARRSNGYGGQRSLQDNRLSASRAAQKLIDSGQLSFGPRPKLLPSEGENIVRLLPKR